MNLIKKTYSRYSGSFIKYLLVGIIWSLLNIAFMWLLIDKFKLPTIMGSTIVVLVLFITKFYAYSAIGFMEKNFLKYASTSIGFGAANVFLMWLFVDVFYLSTVISSTAIAYGLFFLRFVVFDKVGLIKRKDEQHNKFHEK